MISVVTAYYNRKRLFLETLRSIAKSAYKDFEVIVVDDASDEEERVEDLQSEFSFLKVVRVEKEDKWYNNSCMPYNAGIVKASGDIIMLQNPECCHIHDVLSHVVNTVDDSNYVSMSTYAINEKLGKVFLSEGIDKKVFFNALPQRCNANYNGWYNHSKYNPTHYHFCAALTKNNIDKLGGFDERFAKGIAFEDNEILYRIDRLGLNKIISDKISVVHQWHPKVFTLENPEHLILYKLNEALMEQIKNEPIIKVNNSYYE